MKIPRLLRLPSSPIENSLEGRAFVCSGFAVAVLAVVIYGQDYVIPAIAVPVLALISGYRLGAAVNILACALTLAAATTLLFTDHPRSDLIIIDDFNIFLIILTAFVGLTTSIFSATYLAHEIDIGRLTPMLRPAQRPPLELFALTGSVPVLFRASNRQSNRYTRGGDPS